MKNITHNHRSKRHQEPRRVLIIDDNPSIHEDFCSVFMPENSGSDPFDSLAATMFGKKPTETAVKADPSLVGFELGFAHQGEEGLEKIRAARSRGNPYQLAFVDMRMPPGWDGLETIEKLWAEDPRLQVVICSAYSDYQWRDIHERLGDSDSLLILKKPFDTAEVKQLAFALTTKWIDRQIANEVFENLRRSNEKLESEIGQRRIVEEKLQHQSLHDPLTLLPNRTLFQDRLTDCIGRSGEDPDYLFGVLFLDLDNFKFINDSFGHSSGDTLLNTVAMRITDILRDGDVTGRSGGETAARMGGDEFVVLLDGIRKPEAAFRVAERIHHALSKPISLDQQEVTISTSIGIAIGDRSYTDAEDILRDADTALFQAKHAGRECTAVFDERMHALAARRTRIENALHQALPKDQLQLYYQPIIDLESGEMSGVETLLRWIHPEFGIVPTLEFIGIAEDSGLIVLIGEWVIREAFRQFKTWERNWPACKDLTVNINLSPNQFAVSGLADIIVGIAEEEGVALKQFQFELTETAFMKNHKKNANELHKLRMHGCKIALDDFGTGYSSLSQLHNLPIDTLKIDQAFVQGIDVQGEYANTIQAIVTLAHNRGMLVVAEGIETFGQLVQTQSLECDYGQGYYFSKPIPGDHIQEIFGGTYAWFAVA